MIGKRSRISFGLKADIPCALKSGIKDVWLNPNADNLFQILTVFRAELG